MAGIPYVTDHVGMGTQILEILWCKGDSKMDPKG